MCKASGGKSIGVWVPRQSLNKQIGHMMPSNGVPVNVDKAYMGFNGAIFK